MVDGDALVMTMAMILSKFPVPARCQNGVSGSESWFLVAAAEWNSFWKLLNPPQFLGRKQLIGAEGGRGAAWGGHTPPDAGSGGPAPGVGLGPLGLLSVSPSGYVDLLVKNIFLAYFPGFFLIVDFMHKNKTPR